MTDEPQTTTARAEKEEELRYSEDELRENARSLLGVSPHAIAAIFVGEERQTLTLKQAKQAVDKYVKREQEVGS